MSEYDLVCQSSRFMNYGARMYDPVLGRFLSVDPLWQAFPSLTPYQYAFNSPLSYIDPTGLAPQKEGGDRILYGNVSPEIEYSYNHNAFLYEMMQQERESQIENAQYTNDFEMFLQSTMLEAISWLNKIIDDCERDAGAPGGESGGGRTGPVDLSEHSNINTEGLTAEQVSFLETVINESAMLQTMMWSIINSGVKVNLGTIAGDFSDVSDNGRDEITWKVAKKLFDLDVSNDAKMAGALQHLGHELAHVTGRITGDRIKNDQMHPSGIKAEELRAQQIGNQVMRNYIERMSGKDLFDNASFNRGILNYTDKRGRVYNLDGMYFPGDVDFTTFRKSRRIRGGR